MSQFYKMVPGEYPPPREPSPDEVVCGDWWSVSLRDQTYILEYISGELSGRLKHILISREECEGIVAGNVDIEKLLISHGAS